MLNNSLDPVAIEIELEADAIRAHERREAGFLDSPVAHHVLATSRTLTEAVVVLAFALGLPAIMMVAMR